MRSLQTGHISDAADNCGPWYCVAMSHRCNGTATSDWVHSGTSTTAGKDIGHVQVTVLPGDKSAVPPHSTPTEDGGCKTNQQCITVV